MSTKTLKNLSELITSLLMGIGFMALLSPVFFYWWIHGSYERYVWIINGPEPYCNFGSGPYQMFTFFVLPVAIGIISLTLSVVIRRKKLCLK